MLKESPNLSMSGSTRAVKPTGYGLLSSCLLLREKDHSSAGRERLVDTTDQQENERQRVLRCRSCELPITSEKERIEAGGSHHHTFFNPAGILFELGCFAAAQGCRPAGDRSTEFSWFAGYVWRVALCRGCGIHLGWHFTSASNTFFGLILNRLRAG